MATANSRATLGPRPPAAPVVLEGNVPRSMAQHLLRSQGQINMLAAEQDVEILALKDDIDRLEAELETLKARIDHQSRSNDALFWVAGFAVVIGVGCMALAKRS
ncbi:hypothetical protein ACHAPU_008441 [Fusarium lateritium]